jgi:hypothetical protein
LRERKQQFTDADLEQETAVSDRNARFESRAEHGSGARPDDPHLRQVIEHERVVPSNRDGRSWRRRADSGPIQRTLQRL